MAARWSDGGWVADFEAAGIAVNRLRPANAGVRVAWTPEFVERHHGAPLKNVAVSVLSDGAGGEAARGDPTITRDGVEGGPISTLSVPIRRSARP